MLKFSLVVPAGVATVMSCPVSSHNWGSGKPELPSQSLLLLVDPGSAVLMPFDGGEFDAQAEGSEPAGPALASPPMLSNNVSVPGAATGSFSVYVKPGFEWNLPYTYRCRSPG
jgi:hypothetical protein